MNFAILRVEKLKTLENIEGASSHNLRQMNVPNADTSKKNIYTGAKNAAEAVKAVWKKHGIKPRKNAVAGNEYLITASPDFWKGKSRKEVIAWANDCLNYLKKKHGDGVIQSTLHLDETSPHLQVIITAIHKDKNGKMQLSAKHFFDNPKGKNVDPNKRKLVLLQTDFSEYMQRCGHDLERGIEGSNASHKTIRKYYGELERELDKATKEVDELLRKEAKPILDEEGSMFSYKSLFEQAKRIIKKLGGTLNETKKLNTAAAKKYGEGIEKLEGKLSKFRISHTRLEHLYELAGLEKDDSEAFKKLTDAAYDKGIQIREDQEKAAQKASEELEKVKSNEIKQEIEPKRESKYKDRENSFEYA